jgi:hypothetical protein
MMPADFCILASIGFVTFTLYSLLASFFSWAEPYGLRRHVRLGFDSRIQFLVQVA